MASWAQAGDDPAVRPREWLDGSGCDTWILHTTTDDPLSNAAAWTRDAVEGPDQFGAALDRWTAYYRDLGIEALAYGALVLRRRDGVNWSRGASLPPRPLEPASSHLLRMFAGVDATVAGQEALLARRLAVAPAARFEQIVSPSDGWSVVGAALTLEEGLGFRADVDEPTLRLLRALDGSSSARDAVIGVARRGRCAARGRAAARDARDRLSRPELRRGGGSRRPLGSLPSRGAGRGRGRPGRDRRGAGGPPPGAAAGRSSPARSAPPARPAVRPRACGRA